MKNRIARKALLLVACAGALVPAGTYAWSSDPDIDQQAQQYADSKPAKLRGFFRQLYRDGEWGAVLNFEQLGLAAMETGDLDIARRSFDEAIARIEQVYAGDENAKKALSMFSEEKVKDFKGEPYERAMAYYYRGLLYARDGDFENARAAFLAADLQDTMAEKEVYAGDFGVMKYLAGWASTCAGDAVRGKTLIEEAKKADASIAALSDTPGKALLLIDAGAAPRKEGTGKYKEVLVFKPGDASDNDVTVSVAGAAPIQSFQTAADIYFQASTRGGRQVDGVLAGKAQFKDDTGKVGRVATDVGNIAMLTGIANDRGNLAGAGAVIGLLGLFAQGVSAATTPAADIRAWQSLPSTILVHDGDGWTRGEPSIASGAGTRPVLIRGGKDGCTIAWGRTRSSLAQEDGGSVRFVKYRAQEEGRREKNNAMRNLLQAQQGGVGLAQAGGAQ